MLDISKLERRWLKYKLKQYFPYMILVILSVFSLIVLLLFKSSSAPKSGKISELNNTVQTKKSAPEQVISSEMLLEPSMQFMESVPTQQNNTLNENVQTPVQAVQSSPIPLKKNIPLPKETILENTIPPKLPVVAPTVVKPDVIAPKPKLAPITRDKSTLDIHELETRFKENSNPNLGLFIARYHYDHSNYQDAYNYALKTNSINNNMEESWLIFAKSLVKLGKTEEAKKTLQLYISQSNSENAKNLYNSLSKEVK